MVRRQENQVWCSTLGVSSQLSSGRKVLDQISEEPKYFFLTSLKTREKNHTIFQYLHIIYNFFNTLEKLERSLAQA